LIRSRNLNPVYYLDMLKKIVVVIVIALAAAAWLGNRSAAQKRSASTGPYDGWAAYGGGPDNIHFSSLKQINRENVGRLSVAWSYDTRDALEGSEMQCNPVVVGGVLYATSPKLRVFALDAATGKELWSFDPNEGRRARRGRNRGVTYWESSLGAETQRRIFFGHQNWLYALDAQTGLPVKSFGDAGRVDLRVGLGRDPQTVTISLTTPGVIYQDLLIVGSLVSEGLPSAPGHIRAYDVRTGQLRWTFHTIPQPGEYGYETWPKEAWKYTGGANNWAGMALDVERGLLFVPTGSAAFDFYGANRHGDNLFANTLLCLEAKTGKRKWHFQIVRHDVWDRDLPAAPTLVTVRRNGRLVDAVAQVTKTGHIFVFERETGKPVFPIEYRKTPTNGVDGEKLAESQPFPTLPPPIARQLLTEEMLTTRTPAAHAVVLERFRQLRSNGQYEPPSKEGTIVFPGFDGGPVWGGGAFDPATGLFYINSTEIPCILRLVERPKKAVPSGKSLYERDCASCHGRDLQGVPPQFPSLVTVGRKLNEAELRSVIRNGVGRMPGFPSISDAAMTSLIRYLVSREDHKTVGEAATSEIELKYDIEGYTRFFDPDGYPAVKPPWGTLNAVDLNKGAIAWQIPLGEHPELAAQGMRDTGSWNYGGPIVTASGLVFIGATNYDKKFRAFDAATGKLLWETTLPFAGNATPATYEVNGRQFVVIAAGGGKRGAPSGGTYVAFALPK
jgi:quinoprotein glucose dehydrogenase